MTVNEEVLWTPSRLSWCAHRTGLAPDLPGPRRGTAACQDGNACWSLRRV